jgi:hypothetical protein
MSQFSSLRIFLSSSIISESWIFIVLKCSFRSQILRQSKSVSLNLEEISKTAIVSLSEEIVPKLGLEIN